MQRTLEHIIDEFLVIEAQLGDRDAMRLLVERFDPRLRRHAHRLTGDHAAALDAVQETWLAIARGLRRLDDPARFTAYAYRIVANKSADWVNRRSRDRAAAREITPTETGATADSDDDIQRLRAALRRLPDDRRLILSMRYLDDLSVSVIADALNIPVGTVKSRLHHARAELRSILEPLDAGEHV